MVLNTLSSFKFGYSQISLKYDFLLNPQFYFRALISYEPYLTKLMIAFVIYCNYFSLNNDQYYFL